MRSNTRDPWGDSSQETPHPTPTCPIPGVHRPHSTVQGLELRGVEDWPACALLPGSDRLPSRAASHHSNTLRPAPSSLLPRLLSLWGARRGQ